ncbi:hypothetical protein [Pontibacter akesuensis]|uniref:Lipocalin-like domain-containing protein n=2 Tax=Pontibacter akesuensis TaxID=388950 RepID=A0A1I7I6Q1_9BACT|nr:hypothetical protein [Pontibacter akesuensis]SFU68629.1 hypothetical protein SAMN04487941_1963 [Pontibacter akesuensis]
MRYFFLALISLFCLSCMDESTKPKFDRELLTNGTWSCYGIRKGHLVGHQPNDPAANERALMDSVTYQFTFNTDFTYTGRRWMVLGSDRAVLSYWYYSGGWEATQDMAVLKLYGSLQNRNNLQFEFEIVSLSATELVVRYINKPADELDTLYFKREKK